MPDIIISGSSCYIERFATRYDTQNYDIILETFMTKSELQDLDNSIRPGATGELYKILGRPRFYDKSWTGANTITIKPVSNSNISNMRSDKVVFVKSISSTPIEGNLGTKGYINVKLETTISGSTDI
jgi:hypothetical protein